ncbi:aspartic proteinase nepenthesin-1-like [Macadamia integrifolia]|uniref:aspartic proteinase nepenthesin-1-like n=1 Tax=Macadamia integrifolia TaxID=60698 RepID=UPI001C53338B|nr:aspartic proteinase nepenthesin-1-like [Macadamia integrifolia]
MAFMETLLSLIYFLSSALLLQSAAIHKSPQSITISLIHPFSVHSPFYVGKNITEVQKFNLLIQATTARMHHLFPATTMNQGKYWNGSSEVDGIGAIVEYTGVYYVAEVGIGSFPPIPGPKGLPYYLIMDTGSHITWVQCEGCNPCFPLTQTPNFPFRRSQSYRSIPCGHRECPTPRGDCYGSSCGFKASYGDNHGPFIRGTIARETLTFSSDRLGATESFNNLFLACGLQSHNMPFAPPNKVAGILGLGPGGPGPSPIWSQVLKKRFSYCFPASPDTKSRLYIGESARMVGPQVVSTPLLKGVNPSLYYVELQDISIAGIRLGLRGLFLFGGCIIDTGSPLTTLIPSAYAVVRNAFIQYFEHFGMQPYGSGSRPRDVPMFDLCFPGGPPGLRFPTMTFHFKGADFVVQPIGLFAIGADFVCVALKSDEETLIGAYQQTEHKFSFDLELGNTGTLFFAPDNCGAPT